MEPLPLETRKRANQLCLIAVASTCSWLGSSKIYASGWGSQISRLPQKTVLISKIAPCLGLHHAIEPNPDWFLQLRRNDRVLEASLPDWSGLPTAN